MNDFVANFFLVFAAIVCLRKNDDGQTVIPFLTLSTVYSCSYSWFEYFLIDFFFLWYLLGIWFGLYRWQSQLEPILPSLDFTHRPQFSTSLINLNLMLVWENPCTIFFRRLWQSYFKPFWFDSVQILCNLNFSTYPHLLPHSTCQRWNRVIQYFLAVDFLL